MTDNEILEQIRQNNPFISSASPLPWDNFNPDLASLNRDTTENIEQLILHKRRNPAMPLAGLILGEAGSGKTHMLARILRRLRSKATRAIFVTVKTFKDPESATQHLLSEILISLKRIHSSGHTQFDMLISEFVNAFHERRRDEGFKRTDNINLKQYLMNDIPELDRNFLKCIMIYIGTSDNITRTEVIDWLKDGLDDEDCLRLGLPSRDVYSMSQERREQEAEKVLRDIGLVLAYAGVSMIICFDQLDSMKANKTLIDAWGNLIGLMVNDLTGILPLCFLRADTWNNAYLQFLDDAINQRLRQNIMIMKSCTLAQAQKIIHDRICNAFDKNENAEEIYTWLIKKLGNKLKPGLPTRMVIELANHEITQDYTPPDAMTVTAPEAAATQANNEDDIIKSITAAYEDEYRKVRDESSDWPPNSDQLAFALEMWLNAHYGVTLSKSKMRNVSLSGYYRDKLFAFMIVTSRNTSPTGAAFRSGTKLLTIHGDAYCCYITEKSTYKQPPKWPATNKLRDIFIEAGGHFVILDSNERVKWYALTALINRVDNGDVNIYLPSINRAATREDLNEFIRRINLLDFPFTDEKREPEITITSEDVLPEDKPKLNDEDLIETLCSIVRNSPMKILSLDKALELLSQQNILMSQEKILDFAESHSKVFRTLKSQNDEMLITLAHKK